LRTDYLDQMPIWHEKQGVCMELTPDQGYLTLLQQISDTYPQGRIQAVQAVNTHITQTYWQVGRQIVEFEQGGKARAEYDKALINRLAADLSLRHGKGFSRSNLTRFRQFYMAWPIGATLSHQLGWSVIVELLKIDDPLERSFYEQQTLRERWSVRELIRQKDSALFLRLAASKDKAGILQLAAQGQLVEQPADLLREPYVFEVLKFPPRTRKTAPRTGADLGRSGCFRRRIAMTLVAACARSTWARGRFGIDFRCQQWLAVIGVGFQYGRASARRGSRQAEAFWTLTPITGGAGCPGRAASHEKGGGHDL
jgi:DUF1016 N-terminal domain